MQTLTKGSVHVLRCGVREDVEVKAEARAGELELCSWLCGSFIHLHPGTPYQDVQVTDNCFESFQCPPIVEATPPQPAQRLPVGPGQARYKGESTVVRC